MMGGMGLAACTHPDWYDPDVPNVCPWCALDRVRALCDEADEERGEYVNGVLVVSWVRSPDLRAALDALDGPGGDTDDAPLTLTEQASQDAVDEALRTEPTGEPKNRLWAAIAALDSPHEHTPYCALRSRNEGDPLTCTRRPGRSR